MDLAEMKLSFTACASTLYSKPHTYTLHTTLTHHTHSLTHPSHSTHITHFGGGVQYKRTIVNKALGEKHIPENQSNPTNNENTSTTTVAIFIPI